MTILLLSASLQAQVFVPGNGVVDVDGNSYSSIIYANGQEWTTINLRTTRYTDGSDIVLIESNADWAAQAVPMPQYTPAYCWYGNDINNKETYGALYSWYAIDSLSNGGRSACPTGWRVPSDADWSSLSDLLVSHGLTFDGTTATTGPLNKLGKSMADSMLWLEDTLTLGVPGNDLSLNNGSGFTGRPGGVRGYLDGLFTGQHEQGMWWDSDPLPPGGSLQVTRYRLLLYGGQGDARHLGHYYGNKMSGRSVRCMRDISTGTGALTPRQQVSANPNPFMDRLMIVADQGLLGKPFTLQDASGRTILRGTIAAAAFTLDLHDLPPGIYHLAWPDGGSSTVVKQR